MRHNARALFALLVTLGMIAVGCSDDPAAPPHGSFTINPEPDSINAPWQVAGPAGYARSGTGDTTLGNLSAGNYTLTWGDVPGWNSPSPAMVTQTFAANGTVEFAGTYVAITGTLEIDVEPDGLDAGWQVEGPSGFTHQGVNDTTLTDLLIGSYTVTWEDVDGYVTPAPTTDVVPAHQAVTIACLYERVGLPFPDTADKLMANFQTVYENRDFGAFSEILHPDFVTILQQSTRTQFPDVGSTLDVAEELRIHERMYAGNSVTDPIGMLVPGIQAITFQTFARQGIWGMSPPSDPIPDTQFALYDVVVLFDRGGLYSTLKTLGSIKFYVTHRDSVVAGATRPYFEMIGQVDLTQDQKKIGSADKSVENVPWGSVKALFR